jgi:RimJ/RimL family protein N-acetyltransferase
MTILKAPTDRLTDGVVELRFPSAATGRPSHDDPSFTLVVSVREDPQFVDVVGVAEGYDGSFDLTHGTAPSWRGRGLASRATRLAADWGPMTESS